MTDRSWGPRAGAVAQVGERRLCKPEVVGSIPISSMALLEGSGTLFSPPAARAGRGGGTAL